MKDIPRETETQLDSVLAVSQSKPKAEEFLPAVWDAAEAFTSPDLEARCEGLSRLVEFEAAQNHALVAYLLFTRLTEPDIELRTRIVVTLADALMQADGAPAASSMVTHSLTDLRTRQIFALLQVVDFDKSTDYHVERLLEYCSYAGENLADILSNRQLSLSIRKQAAHFIGRLGFLDALPTLERLTAKLTQRRSGRDDYGDSVDPGDECSLLPLLQEALTVLTAP